MLKDLLDVGINLVCFGVDTTNQDSIMIGDGKTTSFMKEMIICIPSMSLNHVYKRKIDVKELR